MAEQFRRRVGAVLVLVGGIVLPVVGWVAGVVLIWTAPGTSLRQRRLALVAPPGGLLAAWLCFAFFGVAHSCVGVTPVGARTTSRVCASAASGPHVLLIALGLGAAALAFYSFAAIWRPPG